MMELVDQVVRRFRVVNEFNENKNTIKSIDFSPNGETLISCSEDVIVIYDCETGTQVNKVNSKKYGVDLVRFTNLKNTAIYSSTKIDDTIRHLSLHDKSYITYFKGHSKKVVALCTSPVGDTFLSGSLDKTLRIWDLRLPTHQGLVELTGSPVAAFDPEGLVFAAGINSECIHLYDLRSYEKPFLSHEFKPENNSQWTNLKFSQDGKTMLISSNGTKIRLLDAYHSTPMRTFEDYLNKDGVPIEASFSPDSQYVFSGSTDGKVHVWNADTGSKVCVLNSNHVAPIQCVQFNPKFMMLASACSSMAFWLPSIKST